MAKGKAQGAGSESGEVPKGDKRRVVLRPRAWRLLNKMCEEKERDPTELANQAVQEFLERMGYWVSSGDVKDNEE